MKTSSKKYHDFLEMQLKNHRITEQFPKKQKRTGLQFHCDENQSHGNLTITGFRKPLNTIIMAPENFLELRKYIDRGLHFMLMDDRILWRNNKSKREAEALYHNLHTHNQLNIT